MAEIIGSAEPQELEIKRLRIEGVVIKDKCPRCGIECVRDLADHYLSYPNVNEPTTLDMYCGNGCEHEWKVPIIVKLGVELAPLV